MERLKGREFRGWLGDEGEVDEVGEEAEGQGGNDAGVGPVDTRTAAATLRKEVSH